MTNPSGDLTDVEVAVAPEDAEVQHPTTAQKYRAQFQPKPLYEEVERHPLGDGLVAIYLRKAA